MVLELFSLMVYEVSCIKIILTLSSPGVVTNAILALVTTLLVKITSNSKLKKSSFRLANTFKIVK